MRHFFFLPDFVCDSALPATDFCAGVDFGLFSCLLAFEATFLLVSRLFAMFITPFLVAFASQTRT